ncbi:Gfo/Idh/MocA family protein [Zooshikella harenae]|uniref:Gfo/Idh/MocA family oxidoreductase n=1 Tax=Zooshikella harenae TaxID=2827238 RepID=A0ABS5Z7I8_9GAMM|nr:Gfo/Idh/MocA family oxidoreductase [Zooshikella harenae]MBU2710014.1 Gfo/Idh/MocA family oxidoreductase [Zooshikella harenae]
MQSTSVKWGIAGLGSIAHRFAQDLTQHTPNAQLVAVASRNIKQAESFAQQYGCNNGYSYLELAEDPAIDVVYVASIHPFHKSLATIFLEKGKHVLIEKPATINEKEWDELTALAKAKNCLCLEAMKTVTFPAYQQLLDFLKKNGIQIHSIEASNGSQLEFNENHWIFNQSLSGGVTLDIGVYLLWFYCNLAYQLTGQLPLPSSRLLSTYYNIGVDEHAEFKFNSPIQGKLTASIVSHLPREAIIKGPDLEIVIHDKWWNPKKISIQWQGNSFTINEPIAGGGFQFEAAHFSDLILSNKTASDVIPQTVTKHVIKIMEGSLTQHGFAHLVKSQ